MSKAPSNANDLQKSRESLQSKAESKKSNNDAASAQKATEEEKPETA